MNVAHRTASPAHFFKYIYIYINAVPFGIRNHNTGVQASIPGSINQHPMRKRQTGAQGRGVSRNQAPQHSQLRNCGFVLVETGLEILRWRGRVALRQRACRTLRLGWGGRRPISTPPREVRFEARAQMSPQGAPDPECVLRPVRISPFLSLFSSPWQPQTPPRPTGV